MRSEAVTEQMPLVEEFALPPEYEFMSIDSINRLRTSQLDNEISARARALNSLSTFNETMGLKDKFLNNVDKDAENYISAHMKREEDPELFDKFKQLVSDASYYKAGSQQWYLGNADEEGNYTQPETSTMSKHKAALKELFGDNEVTALPDPEDIKVAEKALSDSRRSLAELSVKRRRLARNNGKKGRELEQQFNEAQGTYEAARITLGKLRVQTWEHNKLNPTQLRANVVKLILDEHQHFTKAEAESLAEDPSRMAKISRFLARHKWLFLAGSGTVGVGMGYGLSKISKGALTGALGLAGAAVLPATAVSVVAVRTTKAVLQSSLGNSVNQHRSHDHRSKQDFELLKKSAEDQSKHDHPTHIVLDSINGLLSKRINMRVERDIRSNRNRVIGAMALSGAAGVASFIAAGDISGSWPFEHHAGSLNHHHATVANHHPHKNHAPTTQHAQPHRPTVKHKPGVVDGYQTNVDINNGEGYDQALTNLAAQKHINLNGAQSWLLYEHLNDKFHGNFLTNDPSYHMNNAGEWGISRAGAAHWNPAVIHEMNRWMAEHDLGSKALKVAKKTKSLIGTVQYLKV